MPNRRRTYADAITKEVLTPLTNEIKAIDMARESKEQYYETRQMYDRRLATVQKLEAKTDQIEPAKQPEHEESIATAKQALEAAERDYDAAEQTFKNFTHQALKHKGLHISGDEVPHECCVRAFTL